MVVAKIVLVMAGTFGQGTPAELLESARTLVLKGNYDEALEQLDKSTEANAEVSLARAECHGARGRYEQAQAALDAGLAAEPENAALLLAASRLNRVVGSLDQALTLADQAIAAEPRNPSARWERVVCLNELGRAEGISDELEWFIDYYNDEQPTGAEELRAVALGAAEYARRAKVADQFDFILNTLLVDARNAAPDDWRADALAGELLLEKYNKKDALPLLNSALQQNPSAVPVLVSLGVSAQRDYDFPTGFSFADQALSVNPHSIPALCLKADLLILDERVAEALEVLADALAVSARSEEVLGRMAACHELNREPDKAKALEDEVLARNPNAGIFYARAGELLESRRQFTTAERMLTRAVEVAPHLAEPRNTLGMLYMRIGREDEARKVFEQAFELDPFHVRVENMRKVLDHLEDYQVLESEHYELKINGDQDGLLGPYMLEFLEKTHASLCERFGYEPPGRTKIEILKNHQWFSARVVGLPSIGTVGACTGDVVALTSPQSLQQSYNWARVLAHEVTHVITLQQTQYSIPHWYTEALAVMTEGYPRPQEWDEALAERVPKRELFNLDTINHAFVRPKTPLDWQMAYCQSLLYAEYMLERFGKDALSKLLMAYRDGMPTEPAIRAVFGVAKEDFEKGYIDYLDGVVKDLGIGPAVVETSFSEAERAFQQDPENAEKAADLALHYMTRKNNRRARELATLALEKSPKDPKALYVLAKMEWSIGKPDEAVQILEPVKDDPVLDDRLVDLLAAIHIDQKRYDEAAQLYQSAHERSPRRQKWIEGLARVYLKSDDTDKLAPMLELLANMDADQLVVRKKLAQIARDRKDWAAAARWARESMYISVRDAEMHRILADASRELGDQPVEIHELETLAQLEPAKVEDGVRLARLYVDAGEKEKAQAKLDALKAEFPDDGSVPSSLDDLTKTP